MNNSRCEKRVYPRFYNDFYYYFRIDDHMAKSSISSSELERYSVILLASECQLPVSTIREYQCPQCVIDLIFLYIFFICI